MNNNNLNWKEFRCSHCNRLQFRYAIEKDTVHIETKCSNCKTFNHFHINLEPIIEVLKKIEEFKKRSGSSSKSK